MSQSHHNAAMQADATRQAARTQAAATGKMIRYQESVRQADAEKLAQAIKDFASLDESSLFRKSDKQLAEFQSQYPAEAPQYALALHEWNRRLVTRQVKATRFAAIVGLIGIIIGSVLGWVLASYSFKQSHQQFLNYISKPKVQDHAAQQSDQDLQRENPDQVSPKP